MAVTRIRQKFQVTIPEDVRRKIPVEIGEYVEVEVQGNLITIKPLVVEDKFSEKDIEALEHLFRKGRKHAKTMNCKEFRDYLKKL
jgi:AbrB family looped-hinge helix DNA binding protein